MIVRGKLLLALVLGSASAAEDIVDKIENANDVGVPKGKENRNLYGEGDVDKYKELVDKYKDHPVSGGYGSSSETTKEKSSSGGGYGGSSGYHDFKFKRIIGDHKTKEKDDHAWKSPPSPPTHSTTSEWSGDEHVRRPLRRPKADKVRAKEIHWVGGSSSSSSWSGDSWVSDIIQLALAHIIYPIQIYLLQYTSHKIFLLCFPTHKQINDV